MRDLARPSLNWLLVLIPISWAADAAHAQVVAFGASALAIVPLARLIGVSTEQLAGPLGPRLGGLMNATFGNLTELVVASFLVAAGQFEVVKASLTGSVLGNLLLVLGLSFFLGGVRRNEQTFSARAAGVHSASLLLAVTGLLLPALMVVTAPSTGSGQREAASALVAIVLIGVYCAAVVFTQVTHAHLFGSATPAEPPVWPLTRAAAVLVVAGALVGLESEILVSTLRPALAALHVSPFFAGFIFIPLIGNAAEHASAATFAIKNHVDVTLEIAIGSSTQVALFVAPALVFISLALGHPMDFVFTGFEIATVAISTLIVAVIALDGRSNWLEGVQLVAAYLIIAGAAFFIA